MKLQKGDSGASRCDVIGLGSATVDTLAIYEGPLRANRRMQASASVRQGGGLVATALVTVARLGGGARYCGALGDDDDARFTMSELAREGVDTAFVRIVPGASVIRTVGIVNPARGQRTLFFCEANAPRLTPGDVRADVVTAARVLFVDGFQIEAALRAAAVARAAGMPVVMDADLTSPDSDRMARAATHVVASLGFAQSRVGRCQGPAAAQRLHDRYAGGDPDKVVGVTSGERGSDFVVGADRFHQPAFRVPVVDTTGCGDVFHGAFALGVAWDWPLRRVVRFASAAAALKCGKLGGRAGIPKLAEVEQFLAGAPEARVT